MSTVTDKLERIEGKWVYIWRLKNVFDGNIPKIIAALKASGTVGVAIKAHNGTFAWDDPSFKLDPFVRACKLAGIRVAFWGYNYLKWNPLGEARVAAKMIKRYPDIDGYLIDVEAEAKYQSVGAKIFITELNRQVGATHPLLLNSYRFPQLHREIPWKILRGGSDADCPQVYFRYSDPSDQLEESKKQFAAMSPPLPFLPAGDMMYEWGYTVTVEQLNEFLQACKDDPDIPVAIMWSMDQMERLPQLWKAYSEFVWPVDDQTPIEEPPLVDVREPLLEKIAGLALYTDDHLGEIQGAFVALKISTLPAPQNVEEEALWPLLRDLWSDMNEGAHPPPGPAPEVPAWIGATLGNVWVHTDPNSLVATRLEALVKGDRVEVFGSESGWLRVSDNSSLPRWVSAKWVTQV